MPSTRNVLVFVTVFLAFSLACRAGDMVSSFRQSRAGATSVSANPTFPVVDARATEAGLAELPTEAATEAPTELPTETATEVPTEVPTQVPAPADTDTPRPTRKPAPPTAIPPPTETFTPAPPPAPTRCPYQYCVIKADCIPGENIRAQGVVYSNGVPQNNVRVRVAADFAGAKVAADFYSGHDPTNRNVLWPGHEGYYQVGVVEGQIRAGTFTVFLIDSNSQQPISEGRSFTTDAHQTGNSCQIAVTDFG